MIDQEGFRENVGIIVANEKGQVLLAKRTGTPNAWQFPQGGINDQESVVDAMYRELHEELGLFQKDVKVLAQSPHWLHYRLPVRFRRSDDPSKCIGQKQKWFLLQLMCEASAIRLDMSTHPEFDAWQWVDYWAPLKHIIFFKRAVYRQVLKEFEGNLPCTKR